MNTGGQPSPKLGGAAELGVIVREILTPLLTLPSEATEREMALIDLLLQARDRERRLLAARD